MMMPQAAEQRSPGIRMSQFRCQSTVPMTQRCALVIGELDVAFTNTLHEVGISVIAVPSLVTGEALVIASLAYELVISSTIVILAPKDTYGQDTWPLAAQLTIWMQEAVIQPAWIVMPTNELSEQSRTRAERAGCVCINAPKTREELTTFVTSTFDQSVELDRVDPTLDARTQASIRRERAGFRDAAVVLYDTIRNQQQKSNRMCVPTSEDMWNALRLLIIPSGYLKDDSIRQQSLTVYAALGGKDRTRQLLREFSETLEGSDKRGLIALLAQGGRDNLAKTIGCHPDNVGRIWLRRIAPLFVDWLTLQ
ncbi:hypothetical protein [Herpetosiphon geysericola]|uniref:Uncharacterized protein n=1 Tax=Herpetosiphon geysericola TaxID=70996 RepID=A0A0P6XIM0_9CHLR|nr:hypothetical protein [Herpetosiphon geysericola]KPL79985.1 hypothetical protein SE18_25710 [Herpetosiphon geysericola]